jgi:hypothetical protein
MFATAGWDQLGGADSPVSRMEGPENSGPMGFLKGPEPLKHLQVRH